jgi:uncharacterized membrane protein
LRATLERAMHAIPPGSEKEGCMYSKVKIRGVSLHPLLVGFPVISYVTALASYAAHAATLAPFWFRNVVGVVTAAIAAVPGFIDWAVGVPKGHPAKMLGVFHMLFNVTSLVLFAVNAWMLREQWNEMIPRADSALLLASLGVMATLTAGALGWKMVHKHHVGDLPTTR